MGRPRQHDLDALLDHARDLWVDGGPDAVTTRALVAASGASNGAIYHAFGSRDGLVARVWAREAEAFLRHQRDGVDEALAAGDPVQALVVAATAPATHAAADPSGAALLVSVHPPRLLTPGLDADGRSLLQGLRAALDVLVTDLAAALWARSDRAALLAVRHCVVELPGVLLLARAGRPDPATVHALDRAVRGVAADPPPLTRR